ncbi:MAG TPA: hypothetical protein VHU88_14485 [Sporichthyaceae bacterium]|jgi:hypothetical protein|nr:hypothetical protein [Sporichthyaceae bacterium]
MRVNVGVTVTSAVVSALCMCLAWELARTVPTVTVQTFPVTLSQPVQEVNTDPAAGGY